MTHEQIERLAMDRLAGELNTDAEALLEQYLAANPQARPWADEMATVYTQMQAAIATRIDDVESASSAPSLCRTVDLNAGRWSVLGRAAVVIFAVLIGMGIGRWSQPPNITSKPTDVVADNTPAQRS
jgi:anti-sigma factor RsiW